MSGRPSALTILTGASRGLGRAMAEQLLQPGAQLLTLSRRPDESLSVRAKAQSATLEQWAADLSAPAEANGLLGAWLSEYATRHAGALPARVNLIQNAALITAPGPIDDVDPSDLAAALRVGLEAPLLLTATFLRMTAGWGVDRRILLISSGLGRRPMAGSAPYCAIKAGIDHFARALALDEAAHAGGAKVVSLAPGVIDTDMQQTLRSADRTLFPEGAGFAQLKASGGLDTPAIAADKVLAVLDRPDFGSVVVTDVRTLAAA